LSPSPSFFMIYMIYKKKCGVRDCTNRIMKRALKRR